MIATGFNAIGQHAFRQWFQTVTDKAITDEQIQAYFDTNEYMDFNQGQNLSIEVPASQTTFNAPATFLVCREHVLFVEAEP